MDPTGPDLGLGVEDYLGAPVPEELLEPYGQLARSMIRLHDAFSRAAPDARTMRQWTAELDELADRFTAAGAEEDARCYGRTLALPSRGQTWTPTFIPGGHDGTTGDGTVTFGSAMAGARNIAHGGAVMALIDEAMGWLIAAAGRPRVRTAYLTTNFRSFTPVGVPLTVRLCIDSEVGRKVFVSGQVFHGEVLCADAEGLFLHMLAGQD